MQFRNSSKCSEMDQLTSKQQNTITIYKQPGINVSILSNSTNFVFYIPMHQYTFINILQYRIKVTKVYFINKEGFGNFVGFANRK